MKANTIVKAVAATSVLVAVAGGTVAASAAVGADGSITACYAKSGTYKGLLRVIDPDRQTCSGSQNEISWSEDGLPGPAGPAGPAGPQGPAGAAGTSGTVTTAPTTPAASAAGNALYANALAGPSTIPAGSYATLLTITVPKGSYLISAATTASIGSGQSVLVGCRITNGYSTTINLLPTQASRITIQQPLTVSAASQVVTFECKSAASQFASAEDYTLNAMQVSEIHS